MVAGLKGIYFLGIHTRAADSNFAEHRRYRILLHVSEPQLFDDLLEDYKLNRRASIVETTSRLKNHLRPFFGGMRAADLTARDRKSVV